MGICMGTRNDIDLNYKKHPEEIPVREDHVIDDLSYTALFWRRMVCSVTTFPDGLFWSSLQMFRYKNGE